jgi:hypothetical protein
MKNPASLRSNDTPRGNSECPPQLHYPNSQACLSDPLREVCGSGLPIPHKPSVVGSSRVSSKFKSTSQPAIPLWRNPVNTNDAIATIRQCPRSETRHATNIPNTLTDPHQGGRGVSRSPDAFGSSRRGGHKPTTEGNGGETEARNADRQPPHRMCTRAYLKAPKVCEPKLASIRQEVLQHASDPKLCASSLRCTTLPRNAREGPTLLSTYRPSHIELVRLECLKHAPAYVTA